MMMKYFDKAIELLQSFDPQPIQEGARLLANTVMEGGSLFSFGASHSFMITEELVYRAGGLMLVNPIYPHGMNLSVRPITLTSQLERLEGLGRELLARSPAKKGDALMLVSNSGRNAATIDMALLAREKGIKTLAITSLSYVGRAPSRHSSGKSLADLCDIVIDNKAPYGDAAVEVQGFRQKICPLSTIAGCAIANALVEEIVRIFVEKGKTPPVYLSANIEGGEEHNARLLAENKNRIHYL